MNFSGSQIKSFFICALLTITFVAYLPALDNSITNWDDHIYLTKNVTVRSLNIRDHFSTLVNQTFIPLSTYTYALEYHFFKLDPFIYHLDNVILHLLNVLLVYTLAARLGLSLPGAFIASLLFGIHPLNVETVAFVTDRKDVLYSFFYLGSIHFYLNYRQKRKLSAYLFSIFCGLLSILAKPMALSLPIILLLFDRMTGEKITVKNIIDKIPFFLYIVGIAWITFSSFEKNPITDYGQGILIWIWTFVFYIRKFFCPIFLSPLYELPKPISIFQYSYLLSTLLFGIILFLIFNFRKNKWFLFAILYYFGSLFFLFRYQDITNFGNWIIVADHYMYLPSLGFCLLVGFWGQSWVTHPGTFLKYGLMSILFFILLFTTFRQCDAWQNSMSVWTQMLKYNPSSPRALVNRAEGYIMDENYDLAYKDCLAAQKIDVNYVRVYNCFGVIALKKNHLEDAVAFLNRGIELKYDYIDAFLNRGNAFGKLRQYDKALADFNISMRINPKNPESFIGAATVYKIQRQYPSAIESYTKAIELNPYDADTLNERGSMYLLTGKITEAKEDLQNALYLNPLHPQAHHNLGIINQIQNKEEEALYHFTQAINLNPDSYNTYHYRAQLNLQRGAIDQAYTDAQKAEKFGVPIAPNDWQQILKMRQN